jgi:glutathione S-transferase
MKLYNSWYSGNCYKVRLLLHHLGIPFEVEEIPLRMSAEAAAAYRETVSPLGRVPALRLDDGTVLAESNAILWYFAEGTPYLSADRLARAQTLSWLFWEQYDHEPTIAVVRAWTKYFGVPPGKEQELEERRRRGYAALDVMEKHLSQHEWFAGGAYSIADIALYAYTHVCGDGGMSLEAYHEIRAWEARIRAQKGYVALDQR